MLLVLPLCFPETAVVNVAGKGVVPVGMVQTGDKVLAYDTKSKSTCWSKVISFLHREPETVADYLVLTYKNTTDVGAITLSSDHMVYLVERGEMVPSGSVVVGQHLVFCEESGKQAFVEITGSMMVRGKGVYAPLTRAGTIIVDNVVASCYVDAGYSQKAAHMAFKPLRMVSGVSPALAADSQGDIHWYARGLRRVARV